MSDEPTGEKGGNTWWEQMSPNEILQELSVNIPRLADLITTPRDILDVDAFINEIRMALRALESLEHINLQFAQALKSVFAEEISLLEKTLIDL